MTVSELIDELSRFSGELEVWTEGPDLKERKVGTVMHLPATNPPASVPGGERKARVIVL